MWRRCTMVGSLVCAAGLLIPALVWAAGPVKSSPVASGAASAVETVEMFSAIEQGQIQVTLIPKDSTQCRVLINNKTDRPLSVKLPSAFVGVPVLAQAAAGGAGGGTGRSQRNQTVGGGGDLFGGGAGGGGGGVFNVAPEKVGQLKLTTVCLEHGKREPQPTVPYEIKPIETFTDKPEVRELCRMLGAGRLSQRVAQVAAWYLTGDLTWEQLAGKQLRCANGVTAPYFSPQEIKAGMQAVAAATELVQQRKQQSPGKSSPSSQD